MPDDVRGRKRPDQTDRLLRQLLEEVRDWREAWNNKPAPPPAECNCDSGGFDPTRRPWHRYFRNDDGTNNLNADYSGGVNLDLVCGPDELISVARIIWQVRASRLRTSSQNWGSRSELNDGLRVQVVYADGSLVDLTDVQNPGEEVRTNAGWGSVCYDTGPKIWGASDDYVGARWTFARSGDELRTPVWLAAGDRLRVVLADDMTGQAQQTIMAQGVSHLLT